MYFSVIIPTPGLENEAALDWAKGPYEQHQWLWRFFAEDKDASRDFLFRRCDAKQNMPRFYLLSKRKPHTISSLWQVNAKEFNPRLFEGQYLRFELRANPVVTFKNGSQRIRADAVMRHKKQLLAAKGLKTWKEWPEADPEKPLLYEIVHKAGLEWLNKRCDGFKLIETEISADAYMTHRLYKEYKKDEKPIRFSTLDYSGVLEITNPQQFKKALFTGIGRAKAFGCGLLLIKPA